MPTFWHSGDTSMSGIRATSFVGARIVNAVFFPVEGEGSLYAGAYQKERMSGD